MGGSDLRKQDRCKMVGSGSRSSKWLTGLLSWCGSESRLCVLYRCYSVQECKCLWWGPGGVGWRVFASAVSGKTDTCGRFHPQVPTLTHPRRRIWSSYHVLIKHLHLGLNSSAWSDGHRLHTVNVTCRGVTGTARMLHALIRLYLDKLGSKCNQAAWLLFVKEQTLF